MKVCVYNLGCKVNQYECDSIVKQLREKSLDVTEKLESADIYILNTCAVTNEAERKSRQCVARCKSLNANAKVFVCGCASQNNAEQFVEKDGVTFVSGVAKKSDIVDKLACEGVFVSELPTVYEDNFESVIERTRAYVKIQDGCDNFCSYCIIPYLRGRSRSRQVASVVKETQELAQNCKEIVLTGIDISSFGKDINSSLADLLANLGEIDCRLRLGSLEVNVIDDKLLSACKGLAKFCPQFHLSLQSGENGVLKKMNRHYTTQQYAEKVQLIREYFPNAGITTDLICGFPLEEEESFAKTLDFLEEIKFSHMHIFGYSPRKGTVAARYKLLDGEQVKSRCARASEVASECKKAYLASFVGKTLEVLTEDKEGEYTAGYSREYIRILLQGGENNKVYNVVGKELIGENLVCEIIK
ncbi:MAG: tRNA (N(6)-L-threonylcarbamoyladenosine(37)-C(2))-methylthiotransferase MtaB [Clostridia bacterium]